MKGHFEKQVLFRDIIITIICLKQVIPQKFNFQKINSTLNYKKKLFIELVIETKVY
jgi:hypothetical protein